jgi:hypothetical protein
MTADADELYSKFVAQILGPQERELDMQEKEVLPLIHNKELAERLPKLQSLAQERLATLDKFEADVGTIETLLADWQVGTSGPYVVPEKYESKGCFGLSWCQTTGRILFGTSIYDPIVDKHCISPDLDRFIASEEPLTECHGADRKKIEQAGVLYMLLDGVEEELLRDIGEKANLKIAVKG